MKTRSPKSMSSGFLARASRFALIIAAGASLAACQESGGNYRSARAYQPIPANVVALMKEKDTDTHAPILIRAYKKEAELEIWKMNAAGTYVHLKTYPMCRWSGQLGPKTREGDRQVPEGFYTITPGQMNPNSAYYLSFNVGYPNAYDKAHDFTGGAIMVHGDCSSAGCFSMTDEQIAEIYAIAREAFGGGQRAIQMQSLPFRMTPENLAKFRFDPNMRFWRQIKEGVDQFEVTRRETKVGVCGGRYVFGASPTSGARPDGDACDDLRPDPELKALVAEKQRRDNAQVAELVSKGVKAVKVVYADGGQHPDFANVQMTSRPDAIARGPVEIPIDEKGRPLPASAQVATVNPPPRAPAAEVETSALAKIIAPQPTPPAATTAFAPQTDKPADERPFYEKLLGPKPTVAAEPEIPVVVPVDPRPADVPLPPRRQASAGEPKPHAPKTGTPDAIRGASAPLPAAFRAYASVDR